MSYARLFFLAFLAVPLLTACNVLNESEPLPTLAPVAELPQAANSEQSTPTPSPATPTPEPAQTIDENSAPAAATAGRLLYFNTIGEGLYTFALDNPEPFRLYELNDISRFLGVSPNGEKLALINEGQLLIASLNGADLTALSEFNDVSWIAWSPDSQRLAFFYNGNVFVVNGDGVNPIQITSGLQLKGIPGNLAWSPDSSQLLFVCGQATNALCLASAAADAGVVQLSDAFDRPFQLIKEPTWSPSGSNISFVGLNEENRLRIFVASAIGSELRQLSQEGDQNFQHAWSADGRQLAFVSVANEVWSINVVNADGSTPTSISLPAQGIAAAYPEWLGTGAQLAVFYTINSRPDAFSIALVDTVSLAQETITDASIWAQGSPGGSQLAYLSAEAQIHVLNAQTAVSNGVITCPNGCEFFTWVP